MEIIRTDEEKFVEVFKMLWQKIIMGKWTDKLRNEVLMKMGEEEKLLTLSLEHFYMACPSSLPVCCW